MMIRMTPRQLNQVTNFIIDNYGYNEVARSELEEMLQKHAEYKTLLVVRNHPNNKILAVARWNILPTGKDAVVLDVIIHPDYRHQDIMTGIILKAVQMYPDLQYIIYERYEKNKQFKKYSIKKFLRRRS